MKQKVLVASGIFILLSVSLLWGYLIFFGVPKDTSDIFADFGFPVDNTGRSEEPVSTVVPDVTVDVASNELSQLTTRPVAGWRSIALSTTTENIIYAEQGTGHIYSINMSNGTEERLDNATISGTQKVYFSLSGEFGVFIISDTTTTKVILRSIATDSNNELYLNTELPPGSENINFISDNYLNYTYATKEGTSGYLYDPSTQTQTELFRIPFTDVTVLWSDNEIFFYNKTATHLKSTLYKIQNNQTVSILPANYGFLALKHPIISTIVYTAANTKEDQLVSYIYKDKILEIPILAIPEKCTLIPSLSNTDKLWCAAPDQDVYERSFVTDWYKGVKQTQDNLWRIDLTTGSAALILDFTESIGRDIDVDSIENNINDTQLIFRNKIDNTLWSYNINI